MWNLQNCLASSNCEKRQVAARTLWDQDLESKGADKQQEVYFGTSEITTSTFRDMVMTFKFRAILPYMLITAINSENEESNTVKNQDTGVYGGVPDMASQYQEIKNPL